MTAYIFLMKQVPVLRVENFNARFLHSFKNDVFRRNMFFHSTDFQALVSLKKYMRSLPPPLPYFKVNICPLPLPHFASIFFAYL
jgi:hypothetical protein